MNSARFNRNPEVSVVSVEALSVRRRRLVRYRG